MDNKLYCGHTLYLIVLRHRNFEVLGILRVMLNMQTWEIHKDSGKEHIDHLPITFIKVFYKRSESEKNPGKKSTLPSGCQILRVVSKASIRNYSKSFLFNLGIKTRIQTLGRVQECWGWVGLGCQVWLLPEETRYTVVT